MGVTIPAIAVKAAINIRNLTAATMRDGTPVLDAESADKIVGQYDECKNRPTTDLDQLVKEYGE